MSLSRFPHGISSNGVPILGNGQQDISGITYFVDGNFGLDSNDGFSWDAPFQTVARAMAISHANIALNSRGWAARNTIYIKGDWFTEDLVLGCQKTDIIGVGSADGFKGAGITGSHAFATTTAHGLRWINVNFRPSGADDIHTLTATTAAQEFHVCRFHAAGTSTAVSAIDATASNFLKVEDCDFTGAFSGDVIDIGAGAIDDLRILRNKIMGGANDGIIVTDTTTVTGGRLGLIQGNDIYVNNITISDGADSTIVVNDNRCVTPAAYGATSHVITVEFAANNYVTANGASYRIPILTDIEV